MYVCEHCGVMIDRDRNAAINLARLGETHRTGDTGGTGTGSSSAATDSGGGDGRGAMQESATTRVVDAAGEEASTRHDNTVGRTGTASSEGEAA